MYTVRLIRKEALCSEMSSSVKVEEICSAGIQWTQSTPPGLDLQNSDLPSMTASDCWRTELFSLSTCSLSLTWLAPMGWGSLRLFYRCSYFTPLDEGCVLCYSWSLIYLPHGGHMKIHAKWKLCKELWTWRQMTLDFYSVYTCYKWAWIRLIFQLSSEWDIKQVEHINK